MGPWGFGRQKKRLFFERSPTANFSDFWWILGDLGSRNGTENRVWRAFFSRSFSSAFSSRFFMVFRRVETLILSLPSRRNTIFYEIDVFEKDSKKVGFSLNFGGQKLRKISKNGCPNTSNFCTSIFLRFFTIFTDFGSILGGSGASKNHQKLLKIDFLVVCDRV